MDMDKKPILDEPVTLRRLLLIIFGAMGGAALTALAQTLLFR